MVRPVITQDDIDTKNYQPRIGLVEDGSPATALLMDLITKAGGKPMPLPRSLSDRLLASQKLDRVAIRRIQNAKSLDEVREYETALTAATRLHLQFIARKLTYVDAIVLPGSEYAIPPEAYHDTAAFLDARFAPPSDVRLQTELLMADYALSTRKLPLLGISEGMQLLVVKTGGRLTPSEAIAKVATPAEKTGIAFRKVDSIAMTQSQSILGAILEGKQAELFLKNFSGENLGLELKPQQLVRTADINSRELTVTATNFDGSLVEAIEHKSHPFCMGVQFHPEFDLAHNLGHDMLIELVDFARSLKLPLRAAADAEDFSALPHFLTWHQGRELATA